MPESSNLKNRIILNKNDKANFTSRAALNCFSAESIRFMDMAYKPYRRNQVRSWYKKHHLLNVYFSEILLECMTIIITVMKKIILYIIQCFFPSVCTVQIHWGGGGGSSRSWDKGRAQSPKNFFWPLGPHFGKKMGGGGGGSLPWIRHCCNRTTIHYTLNICWQVIEHIGSL